ncbi:LamG domain-containing protein [Candidatus Woesearchaeota archaeon]|nr:LamG domain-containing protein [Candidatus Woesearchaeota archaeon]
MVIKKRSQVSMEFLLTTGMMMILFLSVFVISDFRRKDVMEYQDNVELRYPCEYVSGMINDAYAMGNNTKIRGYTRHNMTILGQNRQVLIWYKSDDKNKTYYCNFIPFNVTNSYNTSFTIPRFTNFTVANYDGDIEVRESILDDNLVFWLRMDQNDTDTTINDFSEWQHHVNITVDCNSPGYLGRDTGCYFDESQQQYINLTNHYGLMPPKEITIAVWLYMDSWGGYIIDKADGTLKTGYNFQTITAPYLQFTLFTARDGINWDTHLTATGLETGKWTHVAATYNGSNASIYINGTLANSMEKTGDINNTDYEILTLGRQNDAMTGFWDGTMDDFRVYNRSLTSDEIERLYDSYFNYVNLVGDDFVR